MVNKNNPWAKIFDEMDKLHKISSEMRSFVNSYVDDYIYHKMKDFDEKQDYCESLYGENVKLKSAKIPIVEKPSRAEDEFYCFSSVEDFIYALKESHKWQDVSIANKRALRVLAKDENNIDAFIKKSDENKCAN